MVKKSERLIMDDDDDDTGALTSDCFVLSNRYKKWKGERDFERATRQSVRTRTGAKKRSFQRQMVER